MMHGATDHKRNRVTCDTFTYGNHRYFHITSFFQCSGNCSSKKLKWFWDGPTAFTRSPSLAQTKVKTLFQPVSTDSLYLLHDSPITRCCSSKNIPSPFVTSCLDLIALFLGSSSLLENVPFKNVLGRTSLMRFSLMFKYISSVLLKLLVHSPSSVFSRFESVCLSVPSRLCL